MPASNKRPKNLLCLTNGDVVLNVPFKDNEKVKALGAWFNRDIGYWVIPWQAFSPPYNSSSWFESKPFMWSDFSPYLLTTTDFYPKSDIYHFEIRDYLGIWLKVPSKDRHKAQLLGACYDSHASKWYIPFNKLNQWKKFTRWLDTTPDAENDVWFVYYNRC